MEPSPKNSIAFTTIWVSITVLVSLVIALSITAFTTLSFLNVFLFTCSWLTIIAGVAIGIVRSSGRVTLFRRGGRPTGIRHANTIEKQSSEKSTR